MERSPVLILICTYNEMSNLPKLIEQIRLHSADDILVIDDGSPDGTGVWARSHSMKEYGFACIVREGKLGLGSAIQRGMQYGLDNGYQWVLNLDADFSHDPADLPRLLAARGENVSLVIGSRYAKGGGLRNCSWKRHFVSRCANLYARLLLQWPIRDCSSAYRCYRLSAVAEIPPNELTCRGYGFLEEILWWILRKGGKVVEVPIVYTEREMGESKISIREALGTMNALHRLFAKRILFWSK